MRVEPSHPARRPLHPAAALAAAAAALLSCSEAPPPPEPVARPVKILEYGGELREAVLEYPGRIQAAQRSDLAFEVAGRIVELPVSEGEEVTQGSVLARLDPRDYQSRVDAERANAEAARAEFARIRAMYDEDVASEQQLDVARRNLEVAEAQVRTAQKALEEAVLRAPFDGVVSQILVENFQNVQAKQAVVVVENLSRLEVVVDLPEQDAVRIDPSRTLEEARAQAPRLEVIPSSLPDRAFPARLEEFASRADPVTRTFEVTLSFEPPTDVSILPGMTARVRAHSRERGRLPREPRIPARAVVAGAEGEPFVWVVDRDSMQVSRRAVRVGEIVGEDIELKGGLSSGDWIAISGVHQLREGMAVRRFEP